MKSVMCPAVYPTDRQDDYLRLPTVRDPIACEAGQNGLKTVEGCKLALRYLGRNELQLLTFFAMLNEAG
jgi:hypothetical protein